MMYFGGLESVLSIPFCTVCVFLLHFLERKIAQNSYSIVLLFNDGVFGSILKYAGLD